MKLKKGLIMMLAGVLTVAMVGCSEPETEKVEGGSGAPVEDKKEEEAPKQEELVLIDDELVKIVVTEKVNDEIFGPTYKFSIENKSDQKVTVQSRDTSIDGVMEEPIFSVDVTAGKKANGDMNFMNVENLEGLKNLEGKLVVIDEDYNDLSSYDITID